jgi:exodeoxyribonuclease V alpha subunit
MNGDMGVVIRIDVNDDEENVLVCRFGDHDVTYTQDELNELGLAYAITIHKSQGGQAPVVIMPISTSHYIMLARNLVYTGITRAEKTCVMIGTMKAIAIAVRNDRVMKRNTRLRDRFALEMAVKTWAKNSIFETVCNSPN